MKRIIKSLWVDLLCLAFLGLGEPACFHWELCLLVSAVDPAFIAGHQRITNYGILMDQLDHLPAVMTTSFFLIFSEHPWNKLHTNLPHLQFLANNCVYSYHTDFKLCTYCLSRHMMVLIHEILYLANQLKCSDFLTPPTPLIIPHRLPVLNLLCHTQFKFLFYAFNFSYTLRVIVYKILSLCFFFFFLLHFRIFLSSMIL